MRYAKLMATTMLFLMCSCTAADLAKVGMAVAKPAANGINTSAQIGAEANKQVIVGDQSKQEVEFKKVESVEYKPTTIANEITNINPLFLALLILGWVLPSPSEIWKGIINTVNIFRSK